MNCPLRMTEERQAESLRDNKVVPSSRLAASSLLGEKEFSYFQPLKLLMCWGLCNVWSTLVESGKTLSGPVKISRFPGPNWKPSHSFGMNHPVTHFRGGSSHSISPPLCHLARFQRWGKLVTFLSHGTEQLWRPLAFWLAFLPTANANLKAVGS